MYRSDEPPLTRRVFDTDTDTDISLLTPPDKTHTVSLSHTKKQCVYRSKSAFDAATLNTSASRHAEDGCVESKLPPEQTTSIFVEIVAEGSLAALALDRNCDTVIL